MHSKCIQFLLAPHGTPFHLNLIFCLIPSQALSRASSFRPAVLFLVQVLLDVFKTMFEVNFIKDKLCVPQETYTVTATRKIFDRLAHSSIMRLSEARYVFLLQGAGNACTAGTFPLNDTFICACLSP